jgi:hypothetical protein
MGFRHRQKPVPPNGPSSTTVPQATSERQIAVAPLSLIAVQSRNLMVAHRGFWPGLQFPSAVDIKKET